MAMSRREAKHRGRLIMYVALEQAQSNLEAEGYRSKNTPVLHSAFEELLEELRKHNNPPI